MKRSEVRAQLLKHFPEALAKRRIFSFGQIGLDQRSPRFDLFVTWVREFLPKRPTCLLCPVRFSLETMQHPAYYEVLYVEHASPPYIKITGICNSCALRYLRRRLLDEPEFKGKTVVKCSTVQ